MTINVCPIDGGAPDAEMLDRFYVCSVCREILSSTELVHKSTWWTRRRYFKANPESRRD